MTRLRLAASVLAVTSSGMLTFLAHPGVGVSIAAPFALVPLMLAVADVSPAKAALVGWAAGAFAWLLALQWLPAATRAYTGCSEAIALAVLMAAVLSQGLVFGLAVLLARWGERRHGLARWLTWPLGFAVVEAIMPQLMPYSLGAGLGGAPSLQQAAAIAGMPAVTLVLVIFQALLAGAVLNAAQARSLSAAQPPLLAAAALLLVTFGAGSWRIHAWQARSAALPPLRVGIVQVGLDAESARQDPNGELRRYAALSTELLQQSEVDLLVWAEGAVAQPVREAALSHDLRRRLCNQTDCATLMAQALVLGVAVGSSENGAAPAGVKNSIVLQRRGEVCADCRYDKQRLVPLTERVPFGDLPGVAALFPSASVYVPSARQRAIPTPWGDLVATICYEGLFADVSDQLSNPTSPRLLLNLSSDAWLQSDMARRAHFGLVALRAIEQRKYLVRVATDGISAIVAPSGEVLTALEPRTAGTLVWPVPLNDEVSIYARGGKWTWYCVALIALCGHSIRTIRERLRTWGRQANS